jgi:hypothetical protein
VEGDGRRNQEPDWKESASKEWEYWEYLGVPGRAATEVAHKVRNRSEISILMWVGRK